MLGDLASVSFGMLYAPQLAICPGFLRSNMMVYNEKEGRKRLKNVQFEGKNKAPGNSMLQASVIQKRC